ncbi:hypothetical protein HYDPIDRAFT_116419 [Hydnomerulius pinastri MD-312]|uniref:Uncharacterized protein n=1 Tax=Hydnomerulius pinastri MD-312 TaxID=994086 RepID=A0A0C9VT88_9AGAM|nr:hypothetical protein HYDPIDRAFT_116419 [Hydnomerulius pinastri MD-312]
MLGSRRMTILFTRGTASTIPIVSFPSLFRPSGCPLCCTSSPTSPSPQHTTPTHANTD